MPRDPHGWIQTYTGRQVWPLEMKPEDIDPIDIAYGLGRQARYTGHTRLFYSVAEHTVLMAGVVPDELKPWALLHDASEAYLHDIPRPLKRLPEFTAYLDIEDRVMRTVADRFDLALPMPYEIHDYDRRMYTTEAPKLFSRIHPDWEKWIEDIPYLPGVRLQFWGPEVAPKRWLDAYHRIMEPARANILPFPTLPESAAL